MSKYSVNKRLTKSQELGVTRLLGKTQETRSFLEAVNLLLMKYSHDWYLENKALLKKKYKRLEQLADQISALATFFETTPIEQGEVITEKLIDNWLIAQLRLFIFKDGNLIIDEDDGLKHLLETANNLRGIERGIKETFRDQIELYGSKKDIDLLGFTQDLVSKFIVCMERFPVITETSPDYKALVIIYGAFEPNPPDRLKNLKEAMQVHRRLHNKRGKYKVKLE